MKKIAFKKVDIGIKDRIKDFGFDRQIDKLVSANMTKDEECKLYQNEHLVEIYIGKDKVGHTRFINFGPSLNDSQYGFWCAYVYVPDDWCQACLGEHTPNYYDHIYKIPNIVYTNSSNNIIGWDHSDCNNENSHVNLNSVLKEIINTWLLCKKHRFSNDTLSTIEQEKHIKDKYYTGKYYN